MLPGDVPKIFADIDKSIERLNYKPTTNVDGGVNSFISWYLEYYN
jgi:UDP-glucuronate 4-epimerase